MHVLQTNFRLIPLTGILFVESCTGFDSTTSAGNVSVMCVRGACTLVASVAHTIDCLQSNIWYNLLQRQKIPPL